MAAVPSPVPKRRRSAAARASFRQALVDRATLILRSEGADAVTIRAVTEPLGVSQMAFYTYFDSRAALLHAVWSQTLGGLLQALRDLAQEHAVALEAWRAHVEAFIGFWEANEDFYRIVYCPTVVGITATPETARTDPAYGELQELGRKRIAAVLGMAPNDPAVHTHSELAFAKALGYLQTTLVLRRIVIADRQRLRDWVVEDIVDGVARHQRPEAGSSSRSNRKKR